MRITPKRLAALFEQAARVMGWEITAPRWTRESNNNNSLVGHTSLEHDSIYGWNINQIVNECGGETRIKESCAASEMDAWLRGVIFAGHNMKRETK